MTGQANIRKYENFFPEGILTRLISCLESSDLRRRDYELASESTPAEIVEAARYAAAQIDLKFNVAVLKWYRTSDAYQSEAYIPHKDPERLRSIPLFLATLSGESDLFVRGEDEKVFSVRTGPNVVLLLNSELEHWVSPPIGGQRYFLFLGFDSSIS